MKAQSLSPFVPQSLSHSVSKSLSRLVPPSLRPSVPPSLSPSVSKSLRLLVTLYLILLVTISCRPTHTVTSNRIYSDTTIIREIPKIITLPAERIESPSINIDSLVALIQSGISHETITQTLIREDPETKLRVGIMLDALGNLTAICEQQERQIEYMEQEITRLIKELSETTILQKPSIWQTTADRVGAWIIVAIVLVTIIFLFKFFRR
jgi:hypothetical protein